MIPTTDIIYQLLKDLDLDEGGDWTLTISDMRDDPDKAICIYDTAGVKDGRLMRSGANIMHPGIQIAVRAGAEDYATARDKVHEIAATLAGQKRVDVTTTDPAGDWRVINISQQGDIQPLGMEEGDRRRFMFTFNALTTIEPA